MLDNLVRQPGNPGPFGTVDSEWTVPETLALVGTTRRAISPDTRTKKPGFFPGNWVTIVFVKMWAHVAEGP